MRGDERLRDVPVISGKPETHSQAAAGVLIVDDNQHAANSLLNLDGHKTRIVYGRRKGLALMQALSPNVAPLDIGLPATILRATCALCAS